MSETTNPVSQCLNLLAGPLIWAAHFFVMYGAATLICSSTSGRNGALFLPFAMLCTAIALATLLNLIAGQLIRLSHQEPHSDQPDGSRFLQRGSIILGAAAVLAVLWSAVPAVMLACSGAVS